MKRRKIRIKKKKKKKKIKEVIKKLPRKSMLLSTRASQMTVRNILLLSISQERVSSSLKLFSLFLREYPLTSLTPKSSEITLSCMSLSSSHEQHQ